MLFTNPFMSLTEKDKSKSLENSSKYDQCFPTSFLRQNSNLRKFENFSFNPSSANPTKWRNTLKQIADELFECVEHFVGLMLKSLSFFKKFKKCEKEISAMSY